jgi:4-hydroxyphenylpyruvate dioxygenase-like putative hemolysin
MRAFLKAHNSRDPASGQDCRDFGNSDDFLRREAQRVIEERKAFGLDGLVGSLDCVVINTEPARQKAAVEEFLAYTGLDCEAAFEDSQAATYVLKVAESASFLVRSRKTASPFESVGAFPKTRGFPNTRLETPVFEVADLEQYVAVQKERGVNFLSNQIVRSDSYSFIQTIPSTFSGISFGFIQWSGSARDYASSESTPANWSFRKPENRLFLNIKELDHVATRVEAKDRDPAILEFMNLTNYRFDFSIYVEALNSITNVARLPGSKFAMVFTSGIHPYVDDETSGPTEKFIHNYGTRVHHIAFRTENIEATFDALKDTGMEFLLDLVGSEEEGLKQTFSVPSVSTLLVNEYIHRYGDFDGFFTKGNVTLLTAATGKQ